MSLVMSSPRSSGLSYLAEATMLTDTLRGIQQDLRSLREDVNRLKENDPTPYLPRSGEGRTLELIVPRSGVQEPVDRIPGTSWAEEMDILDPILMEEPSDAARIIEVTPAPKHALRLVFSQCPIPPEEACVASLFFPKRQPPLPLA